MPQIVVRLSDDQLGFLDSAVREGRFVSRADAVRQSVRAMERALVSERDGARIRAVDGPLYPDLEGLHGWAADQPLGMGRRSGVPSCGPSRTDIDQWFDEGCRAPAPAGDPVAGRPPCPPWHRRRHVSAVPRALVTAPPPVEGLALATATADDAPELLVLQRCCWVAEAVVNGTLDIPALHESLDDVRAWTASWDVWTVRRRGRLVAAVRAREVDGAWEVGRLMVAPDLAGHGVGRWLLARAESRAPDGTARFVLVTGSRSARNIDLYERAGYRITSGSPGVGDVVHLAKERRAPEPSPQEPWSGAAVGGRPYGQPMTVVGWLLDSDPALRWQVLRDLTDAPPEQVAAERARVATRGWGARLLALRDDDGLWAGGACFPADFDGDFSNGQPWTSTHPTLRLLRDLGIDPDDPAVREGVALVARGCRWEHDGQAFFDGEVEPCINGGTLAIGAYLGADVDAVAERLLDEQLADGGWNCEAERGSVRSSFDTTICVLEGLLEHERATGGSARALAARRRGEEYLLKRRLFRRLSTEEVVDPAYLRLSFPTWWHYDVLRALEHFRAVGGAPDPRLAEAAEVVRSKQQPDGTWLLEGTHPGAVHFLLEDGDGRPSRWSTLRALRVLRWYDGEAG